ncbi:hypothetical protein IAU59_007259 [Kwoniella sp. CBS 9459]
MPPTEDQGYFSFSPLAVEHPERDMCSGTGDASSDSGYDENRSRLSLHPPRDSLPPPPRIRSASASSLGRALRTHSAQSSRSILLYPGQTTTALLPHSCSCSRPHLLLGDRRSRSAIDFSLPVPEPRPVADPLRVSRTQAYLGDKGHSTSCPNTGIPKDRDGERYHSVALSKLEAELDHYYQGDCCHTCPAHSVRPSNCSKRPSFLSIDTSHIHQSSTSSPLETSKTRRFATPRTPKFVQHALDHLKDHNPLRTRVAQLVVPTHVHLPTPILPIIHLLLIIAHLVLSALIPYLLVKWFIQPLVLWVIALVTIALEGFYLVPGIVLESIALLRRRPIESAWLQSGINLFIMILALAPHSVTVFLLFTATQVPECPSAILYKPPEFANFETHLRWSTCAVLPRVTIMGLVNLVVLLCEIIVTGFAVGLDYRIQRKEERRHARILAKESTLHVKAVSNMKDMKFRRRRTWWRETPEERATKTTKIRQRRWTTGVGRLLWDIEGFVHRRKAKQREARAK